MDLGNGVAELEGALQHARKKFWQARCPKAKAKWKKLAESLYDKLADIHEQNSVPKQLNLTACIRQAIREMQR